MPEFRLPHDFQWYGEKWWQEEQYRGYLPNITPERVDAAIARVAELFGPKLSPDAQPHPAWMFLGPRGTLPLECLVELGSDLLDVEGCLRLPSIIRDLLVPSHFEGTRLELMLAAVLQRKDFCVEFRPELPSGKRSDLRVENGEQTVFFEVKRLSASETQESVSHLSTSLIFAVGEILQTKNPWPDMAGIGYEIELSDAINNLLGTGLESDGATIQGIVAQVGTELNARILSQVPPIIYDVAGVVRVRIGPNIRNCLSGPTLSPIADLKRALTKFLRNVGEQLHPDYPGILVCQTGSVLDASITRLCVAPLLANQGTSRHASAVIFLPVYTSLPERFPIFPPFALPNPAATFPARDLSAYQALVGHFGITE